MKLTCCVHVDLMLIFLLEYLKSLVGEHGRTASQGVWRKGFAGPQSQQDPSWGYRHEGEAWALLPFILAAE